LSKEASANFGLSEMAAAIAISTQEAKDDDEVLSGECRDHGFSYSNNAGHGLHAPRIF
jgi:hypothetical protein